MSGNLRGGMGASPGSGQSFSSVLRNRSGKAVAVLLSVEDEEELERLILAYSVKFREILEASRRRIHEGRGVRHKDFWRDVEKEKAARKGKTPNSR